MNSNLTLKQLKKYLQGFLSSNRFCKFNINELLEKEPKLYNIFGVEDNDEIAQILEEIHFLGKNGQYLNIKRSTSVMENTIQNALKHTKNLNKMEDLRMGFKILELTKENEKEYVDQVADLEDKVLDLMNKQGQVGQFFTTGKEDISEYVKSKENSVYVALDEEGKVIAATYITEGQKPYTYNDITKYYKCGDDYKQYVREQYSSEDEYKADMLNAYQYKIKAYQYAKEKILHEHPEYSSMKEFLIAELNSEGHFDEKSILREKLNRYMSEYIDKNQDVDSILANLYGENSADLTKLYERFYWTTAQDVSQAFDRILDLDLLKNPDIREYEDLLANEQLTIYDKKVSNPREYYTANTSNAVEIDTYITDPDSRHTGLARILVFEGLKKYISKHFDENNQDDMFLCSTLHEENLSSKYVSEFFGLKDNISVKRREGRTREVHMHRIAREDKDKYLNDMENKFIVIYDYNPNNKHITPEEAKKVVEKQLAYEQEQYENLTGVKNTTQSYTVRKLFYENSKAARIKDLTARLQVIRKKMNPQDTSDDFEEI